MLVNCSHVSFRFPIQSFSLEFLLTHESYSHIERYFCALSIAQSCYILQSVSHTFSCVTIFVLHFGIRSHSLTQNHSHAVCITHELVITNRQNTDTTTYTHRTTQYQCQCVYWAQSVFAIHMQREHNIQSMVFCISHTLKNEKWKKRRETTHNTVSEKPEFVDRRIVIRGRWENSSIHIHLHARTHPITYLKNFKP